MRPIVWAPSSRQAAAPAQIPAQTESDAYTRYELLAPGTAKFRIIYEVTANTPGATYYFNPIRKGSVASDEHVYDRATGKPLEFDVVGIGHRAGRRRAQPRHDADLHPRQARAPGAARRRRGARPHRQDVLGRDELFHARRHDRLHRPLGIKRNAIVLPKGYEIVSSNYPSQILQETDGRIGMSFWNCTPAEAPVTIRARPVGERRRQSRRVQRIVWTSVPIRTARSSTSSSSPRRTRSTCITTTPSRAPGTGTYINEVRAGSTVSKPRARNLDTGEELKWEVLKGDAITRAEARGAERHAAERNRRVPIRAGEGG